MCLEVGRHRTPIHVRLDKHDLRAISRKGVQLMGETQCHWSKFDDPYVVHETVGIYRVYLFMLVFLTPSTNHHLRASHVFSTVYFFTIVCDSGRGCDRSQRLDECIFLS